MNERELAELARFFQDLKRRVPELMSAAERVGEMGWPIPMWMTLSEVAALAEAHSEATIDAMFVDLFARDVSRLEALLKNLTGDKLPVRYRTLVRQCAAAYTRGEHQIAVPALLVVLEGTLADLTGASARKAQAVQLAKRRLGGATDDLDRIAWTSLHAFTGRLFTNAPFDGPAPTGLNRHWLLHGRDAAAWSQADALRLLHAIDTLLAVAGPS